MTRLYVAGTDTGIGKTRVTASLAAALQALHGSATIVKLVQTGFAPGQRGGDAELAAAASACLGVELRRYPKPADPWTAANAIGARPPRAAELAKELARIPDPLAAEGSGGVAVPLNETESVSEIARLAGLVAMLAVGLRLGCMNHAILSLEYLARRGIPVLGAVLVEHHPLDEPGYAGDVERVLRNHCPVLGVMPFEPDPIRCVERGAHLFTRLGKIG